MLLDLISQEQIYTGNLILINKDNSIKYNVSATHSFNKINSSNVYLEENALNALTTTYKKTNINDEIIPVSGYRTNKEQQRIYDTSLFENGIEFTKKFVALAGCSEHETGLAIDVALNQEDIDFITPHFPYSGVCDKFRKNLFKNGFIQRYPKDKEAITNIAHEPWHFRYVGVPHSMIIWDNDLTLEEYTDYIKQFTFYKNSLIYNFENNIYSIFYVHKKNINTINFIIREYKQISISGNNIDGFIITARG